MSSFITGTFTKYDWNDQVKEYVMGRECSRNVVKRNAYRILVGKVEGKRLLGRPRCRSVVSIKMCLRGKGWDGMDWDALAQDDWWVVLVALNLCIP
jgi:hypothetical protein